MVYISGDITNLEDTILDLRTPVLLDNILDKFPREDGLCHVYILPGKQGEKKLVSRYNMQVDLETDRKRMPKSKAAILNTFFKLKLTFCNPLYTGLEVQKLEYSLRLKIKRNDWLLADTYPQAANHCALF